MKNIKLLVLFSGLILFFQNSWAHIPEYDTIMQRVAGNHGNGTYQIQRTIKWIEAGTPLEVSEVWTVGENGQVKVSITGIGRMKDQIAGEISYSLDKKSYAQEGRILSSTLPPTFSEHLFFSRSSKTLRSLVVRMGLAPRESLENRPSLGIGPNIKYKPQGFMSLSRVDGVITYAVGNPQKPSLFIEQDQFVLTKAAFPQGPAVVAKSYQSYPNSFYFPKTVTYSWGDKTLEVTTQKVSALGKKSGDTFSVNPSMGLKIPSGSLLTEFYSQFR